MSDALQRLWKAREGKLQISHEELLGYIEAYEAGRASSVIAGEALQVIALTAPKVGETMARDRLHDPDKTLREGAAQALMRAHGLPTPWSIADSIPWRKRAEQSDPVRYVYAFSWLDTQVVNGGFSQYFCNGYGSEYRDVLGLFRAIDALKSLAIFQRALAAFDVDEALPAEAAIERLGAGQSDQICSTLTACDHEYDADEDHRMALLAEYMLRHQEALRGSDGQASEH